MIRQYLSQQIRRIVDDQLNQRLEQGIDVGTGTTSIRDDRVHVAEAVPAVQLEGTETNGENLSIRENAGAIELYDEAAAAVASTWDLNPPLENASIAASESDTDTQSGDGTTVTFTIAHSLGSTPTAVSVQPTSADAAGDFYVSNKTSTDIDVTYAAAPASGTSNLSWDVITHA